MKKLFVFLFVTVLLLCIADKSSVFAIDRGLKPGITLEEFKAYWEQVGTTPEGTVKCLIIAALETVKEGNKDGKKMWGMVLHKDSVAGNGEPDNSQRLAIDQFSKQVKGTNFKGAIAASYLGGTPENGYTCSYENDLVVDERQTIRDEEVVKLFIQSGGKDMATPIRLMKNKYGYWKIVEYSSVYTGVKPIDNKDF
jgi:hypothetical protein